MANFYLRKKLLILEEHCIFTSCENFGQNGNMCSILRGRKGFRIIFISICNEICKEKQETLFKVFFIL